MRPLQSYISEAETILYSDNFEDKQEGFRKYFDEESMIKWFIVSEVFKNVDSKNFSSIYFYKDRGGKITMGPIWDFDLGAGNAAHCEDCMYPEGWYILNNYWFARMYEDTDFKEKLKTMWNQYKPYADKLVDVLEDVSEVIQASQKINFEIWPDFGDPRWAVAPGFDSHEEHLSHLKNFLQNRIAWMHQEINL